MKEPKIVTLRERRICSSCSKEIEKGQKASYIRLPEFDYDTWNFRTGKKVSSWYHLKSELCWIPEPFRSNCLEGKHEFINLKDTYSFGEFDEPLKGKVCLNCGVLEEE